LDDGGGHAGEVVFLDDGGEEGGDVFGGRSGGVEVRGEEAEEGEGENGFFWCGHGFGKCRFTTESTEITESTEEERGRDFFGWFILVRRGGCWW
jgi:hypothetical protein